MEWTGSILIWMGETIEETMQLSHNKKMGINANAWPSVHSSSLIDSLCNSPQEIDKV